jgi:hypothetical protein
VRRAGAGRALLLLLATAATAVPAAGASATERVATGLHDVRHCEILEVRGALPDVVVTVWNTIGLNRCPKARWNALDAAALAKQLGDTAVILNGPRHWVIDAASGDTGAVRSFDGLRMRKVATIPIRTAAELAQTPYTERTIDRRNSWRYRPGRLVYELLAPGGDRYVMQSYAQIRDRRLTLGALPSLGRRLALPSGWRYRTRRLRRDLVLSAKGSATIVQDELQNTYQLAPPARPPAAPARHRLAVSGTTRTVGSPAPGVIEDRGTVTGPPFGHGAITLDASFAGSRLSGSFRIDAARGSARGTFATTYTISGGSLRADGTARFTGGTGAYRRIAGADLRVTDHNTLDGQSGRITLDGVVTY